MHFILDHGLYSVGIYHLIGKGILVINPRRSSDRLRFIMGILIPIIEAQVFRFMFEQTGREPDFSRRVSISVSPGHDHFITEALHSSRKWEINPSWSKLQAWGFPREVKTSLGVCHISSAMWALIFRCNYKQQNNMILRDKLYCWQCPHKCIRLRKRHVELFCSLQ